MDASYQSRILIKLLWPPDMSMKYAYTYMYIPRRSSDQSPVPELLLKYTPFIVI